MLNFHPRKKKTVVRTHLLLYQVHTTAAVVLCVLVLVHIEKKYPGIQKKNPGVIVMYTRRKTPSVQMEAQKWGHEKNPVREMPPKLIETAPFREIPYFFSRGSSKPSPGGHLPTPPRSRSSAAAPVLSPGVVVTVVYYSTIVEVQ